jgi:dipeptidyl aminopeptidase/acylaminoacyl peptidase
MKRLGFGAAVAMLIAAGCVPEKRVVWSPDGDRAAVLAGDGLYVCDAEGRLSPRLIERAEKAAWFPDGRLLAVVRSIACRTWSEAVLYLNEDEQREIARKGRLIREEVLDFDGDWNQFGERSITLKGQTGGEVVAALMYVRDEIPEGVVEKIGAENWGNLQKLSLSVRLLEVYDATRTDGPLAPVSIVTRWLDAIGQPVVAPDGEYIAYAVRIDSSEKPGPPLYVAPARGDAPERLVAAHANLEPDWSPDGRYLAFAKPSNSRGAESDMPFGSIARCQVREGRGDLLEKFPAHEDLAGIVFDSGTRVKYTREGRIIFATAELHLPATAKDMPQYPSLFAVHPDHQATVTRLIPRAVEPEIAAGSPLFELSPDGKRIAVFGAKNAVYVVRLGNGDYEIVKGTATEGTPKVIPVWRNSHELCVELPPSEAAGSGGRREIALWSDSNGGKLRVLSEKWGGDAARGFLYEPKEGQVEAEPERSAE